MLKAYLKNILEISTRGDAREETYYATLQSLLNEFASQSKYKHLKITTLPKKTEAGNPGFCIWDGTQHIIGYIEAKAPTLIFLGFHSLRTKIGFKRWENTVNDWLTYICCYQQSLSHQ